MGTLFNPMGRIGPITFRNAALILIVIGAVLNLTPLVLPGLWWITFAGFGLIYPWAVIWVKRLHDAGKSGWLFLAILVAMMIVSYLANRFLAAQFMPPAPTPVPGQSIDIAALMQERILAAALPGTIIGVVISLAFALVINEELKTQPVENDYGPPATP